MMKDEKGQYERIIKELTSKFNDHPNQSKPALQNKLKQEAWEPTQDAIKVWPSLRQQLNMEAALHHDALLHMLLMQGLLVLRLLLTCPCSML